LRKFRGDFLGDSLTGGHFRRGVGGEYGYAVTLKDRLVLQLASGEEDAFVLR
jgi:hypothetical protein